MRQFPEAHFPQGDTDEPRWVMLWERNPEVRVPKSFMLDSKHVCFFLLQEQILPQPFKDVIYTKIFEKIVCNKGNLCHT